MNDQAKEKYRVWVKRCRSGDCFSEDDNDDDDHCDVIPQSALLRFGSYLFFYMLIHKMSQMSFVYNLR